MIIALKTPNMKNLDVIMVNFDNSSKLNTLVVGFL